MPVKPPPLPISAPGLVGPVSTFSSVAGPRANRRARSRPYAHVRLVIDLRPVGTPPRGSAVERLAALFHRRAPPDLLSLVAATLHALSARHFRWVDHWELQPHGWLPLPPGDGPGAREPVGQLLALLADDAAPSTEGATGFSARLSDTGGGRADLVLRSRRRSGRGAITLDLYGSWTSVDLASLRGAFEDRLPVAEFRLDRYRYEE